MKFLEISQVPIKEIRVIGGGAKSQLWKQILADIFENDMEEINTNQGGALGAGILAAVAAGHFATVKEGCEKMIRVTNKVSPIQANVEFYNKKYPKFVKLYESLYDWYKL